MAVHVHQHSLGVTAVLKCIGRQSCHVLVRVATVILTVVPGTVHAFLMLASIKNDRFAGGLDIWGTLQRLEMTRWPIPLLSYLPCAGVPSCNPLAQHRRCQCSMRQHHVWALERSLIPALCLIYAGQSWHSQQSS